MVDLSEDRKRQIREEEAARLRAETERAEVAYREQVRAELLRAQGSAVEPAAPAAPAAPIVQVAPAVKVAAAPAGARPDRVRVDMPAPATAPKPAPDATAGRSLGPELVPKAAERPKGAAQAPQGATDTTPAPAPELHDTVPALRRLSLPETSPLGTPALASGHALAAEPAASPPEAVAAPRSGRGFFIAALALGACGIGCIAIALTLGGGGPTETQLVAGPPAELELVDDERLAIPLPSWPGADAPGAGAGMEQPELPFELPPPTLPGADDDAIIIIPGSLPGEHE